MEETFEGEEQTTDEALGEQAAAASSTESGGTYEEALTELGSIETPEKPDTSADLTSDEETADRISKMASQAEEDLAELESD